LDIDSLKIIDKPEFGFKMNKLMYMAENKKEMFPIIRGKNL
tara:strand:+ start:684 stop:806 length:123 start_codon:yes stop_codon:yes gene_type:complete